MSEASFETLVSTLGSDHLRSHPAFDFEGHSIIATWAPGDGDALCKGMAALTGAGLTAVVRGAGIHARLGAIPTRSDVFVSTERLGGIQELEPAEGVCRAGAGTTLAALRSALEGTGWELPLDAAPAATLGGVLAAAVMGPRCHGYGPTRDAVLGLDVVLSDGAHTRCGGRVVKNVTGYDLAKLYVGSLGTLGVIENAWLRLRPCPEQTLALRFEAADPAAAAARAMEIARHVAVRACGWIAKSGEPCEGIVELASDEASVAAAMRELSLDAGAIGEVATLDPAVVPGGMRFRIPALPTQQARVALTCASAGARTIAFPGLRFVWADFPKAAEASEAFAVTNEAGLQGCGLPRCEAAPSDAKRGRNVLGMTPVETDLARALKLRFDPAGTLAPGRIVEVA